MAVGGSNHSLMTALPPYNESPFLIFWDIGDARHSQAASKWLYKKTSWCFWCKLLKSLPQHRPILLAYVQSPGHTTQDFLLGKLTTLTHGKRKKSKMSMVQYAVLERMESHAKLWSGKDECREMPATATSYIKIFSLIHFFFFHFNKEQRKHMKQNKSKAKETRFFI